MNLIDNIKKHKGLSISTVFVVGIILAVKAHAFVEHTVHYEVHVPEIESIRDNERAERESSDNGYACYFDDSHNPHYYENGSEIQ